MATTTFLGKNGPITERESRRIPGGFLYFEPTEDAGARFGQAI